MMVRLLAGLTVVVWGAYLGAVTYEGVDTRPHGPVPAPIIEPWNVSYVAAR